MFSLVRLTNVVSMASKHLTRHQPALGSLTWIKVSNMSSLAQQFEDAKNRLSGLKEDPGNEVKLQLYALFKQATSGKCAGSRPGMLDMVGRAKFDAWNALGDISKDEAQKKYVDLINSLAGAAASAEPPIIVTKKDGLGLIRLNRPDKKNAITQEMYGELVQHLSDMGKDKSVTMAAITGTGDFYCSGNDLSNFTRWKPNELKEKAAAGGDILKSFVGAFIDFPKPLVALINGPAVGISVTVLGLVDAVYASDKASFHTPFSVLGQTPEGCSSYTFPKLMGLAKAQEMLIFNKKLTAQEAKDRGLVTEVFPDNTFVATTQKLVEQLAKLPPETMALSKQLVRSHEKNMLHEINKTECKQLVERWLSKECQEAVMNFFQRKSKM